MKRTFSLTILLALTITLLSCSEGPSEKVLDSMTPAAKTTRSEEAFPNQRGTLKNGFLNGQK
ncbi:hypothetical protein [Spirosoma telluris]|uniref:hypothetical protein n=1 Tax=Spirosoma telluris TaxID=2183553 RepID=UPI002FC35457